MAIITTGAHPKALWPGVHAWVMGEYATFPTEYTEIFEVDSSEMAYEEDVEYSGFGLAKVKSEGASIEMDTHSQGATKRYTHVTYALGYAVTEEEMEDNLYPKLGRSRGKALQFSFSTTKEIVHANVLNRATSGSYLGMDGVALLSTAHPTLAGNQSNRLATDADLSEASLEDALVMVNTMKNSRGLPINIRAQKLVVAPQEAFNAERIIKSALQNDTANNAVNAIRSMGVLPGGYVVNHYLTDPDQWFVKTNVPNGLMSFKRVGFEFRKDKDFTTTNALFAGRERYSCGWTDWRSVVGTPGA